jgi:hypothetical protein
MKYVLNTSRDMNSLIDLIAKQALFSLVVNSLIWYFQVKETSIVSPKNFILRVFVIFLLLKEICISIS